MTPEEILLKAADLIGELGWNQGDYYDETTGAMCALGAISLADRKSVADFSNDGERAISLLVNQAGLQSVWNIPDWNDSPERTAEDVILALKGAAHHE